MTRPFPAPEWVHWSDLKWIARSPAHMLEALNRPTTKSKASPMLFGSLTHHRTLVHQHLFALDEFAVWSGERRGNLWKKYEVEQTKAGREIVTDIEDARAQRIARVLLDDPKVSKYLVAGLIGDEREKDREWVSNGRKCAGRLDNVVTVDGVRTLVELKTTHDASARRFQKLARNMMYPEQLGWYADGCEACGDPIDAAVIVAVEVKPPFARKVFRLTPELLARGRTKARDLLEMLIRCEQANDWPGYGDDEEEFDVAPWEVESPELVFPDDEVEAA